MPKLTEPPLKPWRASSIPAIQMH